MAEFHSNVCLIKDKTTGLVLLRGHLKDGLYRLLLASWSTVNKNSAQSLEPLSVDSAILSLNTCNKKNACNRQNSFSLELSSLVNVAQSTSDCQQWHVRLGHLSLNVLKLVLNKIGVSCSLSYLSFCDSCKIGKLSQFPFSSCEITVTKPLELVYSNLWRLAPIMSIKGFRYYIIFVDACTRCTWLYPLKT